MAVNAQVGFGMTHKNSRSGEFACNVAAGEVALVDLFYDCYGIALLSFAARRAVAAVVSEAYGTLAARWPGHPRAPPSGRNPLSGRRG